MASTAMGCEAPLMQQDEWLVDLLEDARIALAGDTLTLDNGQIRLTLLDREVASPDKPLVGTKWVLDSIVDGGAVSSVPAGVTASMRIVDGQLELDAGCNGGGGPVAVTDDTLEFGPLMLTKRACQAGPSSVEQAVTTVLSGTVSYTIDADLLTIDAGVPAWCFARLRRPEVGPPGGGRDAGVTDAWRNIERFPRRGCHRGKRRTVDGRIGNRLGRSGRHSGRDPIASVPPTVRGSGGGRHDATQPETEPRHLATRRGP